MGISVSCKGIFSLYILSLQYTVFLSQWQLLTMAEIKTTLREKSSKFCSCELVFKPPPKPVCPPWSAVGPRTQPCVWQGKNKPRKSLDFQTTQWNSWQMPPQLKMNWGKLVKNTNNPTSTTTSTAAVPILTLLHQLKAACEQDSPSKPTAGTSTLIMIARGFHCSHHCIFRQSLCPTLLSSPALLSTARSLFPGLFWRRWVEWGVGAGKKDILAHS